MKKFSFFSIFKFTIPVLLFLSFFFAIANLKQIETFLQTKFNQYFTYSVCDHPIHYKIGSLDPKFGLSNASVLADANKAAKIWNQASGNKSLFVYDQSDEKALTISLIFDQRTALNNQINNLESQVNQKDQTLQSKINAYYQQEADFKKKLADFYAAAAALNNQIKFWNQKGGASPEVYQQLVQQQDDLNKQQSSLQSEANSLNQTAASLNLSANNYNADISKLNNTISTFNNALSQKPEEGLFDPNQNTIDIYFNNNQNELIHTLAHEMGHAIGLDHNQNQHSIMYLYSSRYIEPSSEDISSLGQVCAIRYLKHPPILGTLKPFFIQLAGKLTRLNPIIFPKN